MYSDAVVKDAMSDIINVSNKLNPSVGLKQFVDYYLPILVNEDIESSERIRIWLEVCKHPYYSVDVIDSSGEVSFVVPPLWSRISTKDVADARFSITEVMRRVQQRQELTPQYGEKFFNECLPYISMKTTSSSHVREWNAILTSYGYSEITSDVESSESEEQYLFEDF